LASLTDPYRRLRSSLQGTRPLPPSQADPPETRRLIALVDRLRPDDAGDTAATARVRNEAARLAQRPEEALALGADLVALLATPHQAALYAETGVRSALGFWLELSQKLGHHLLPPVPDPAQLRDVLRLVFPRKHDHVWVAAVPDEAWLALAQALDTAAAGRDAALPNLLEAARVLSYRLAGAALDRELLRADPALERHASPFLAQNATLIPLLERARGDGEAPSPGELREVDVMLAQCVEVIDRVRRRAGDQGISIRLTYLLARLNQLIGRLREVLAIATGADPLLPARFFKALLEAEKTRQRAGRFVAANLSLLARNITDHASRHGEHYIAEDRAAWWQMARAAAGGGIVIALMAMLKIRFALMHLPPLTEGIVFGLNYSIGFVLIHLLGFSVATKQPAMTAAAIAATIEESHPRELDKLVDLAQNVARTQFVAVLGNVGLAFPVACLIALAWPALTGATLAPVEKASHMLHEVHPLASGALFFAAVAGIGLFLSGLVSGYFDNQARYHGIAARIAALPALARFGTRHAQRLGEYLDEHYGAILGNLFFGMYLGLVGALGNLTGLPVDIRHVAFSSANLGTAVVTLDRAALAGLLPWAVAGVIAIALVNLAVSFALALHVALQSRRLGTRQIARLAWLLLHRFTHRPIAFFAPPPRREERP
jgi:site-specific recombinase